MHVSFEVKTGLMIGRRFDLAPGTPVVFGSEPELFGCLAHDPLVAARHFEIDWKKEGVTIRALDPDAPLLVNGARVSEATLAEGARITAGRTTLHAIHVQFLPHPKAPAEHHRAVTRSVAAAAAAARAAMAAEAAAPPGRTGPDLLRWLDIGPEAQALAAPDDVGETLVGKLAEGGQSPAAIRLQAHLLGPRSAVAWGCQCVERFRGGMAWPQPQAEAYRAALEWAAEPGEERRRAAESAAIAAEYQGAGAWLALGAFLSGGSISPAGRAEVKPDERLTGQSVTGALMALVAADPVRAGDLWPEMLALGAEAGKGDALLSR